MTNAPPLGAASKLSLDELQERARCEASLHEFVKSAWTILEPTTEFVDGWHIEAICLHLEAVDRGEIRNLLVNVPPGTSKSTIITACWPAQSWIQRPDRRWFNASYDANLAMRDSKRSRDIIESAWYQKLWGGRYRLLSDQNAKTFYENSETGWRIASGVGGRGTGLHPDVIIVDDPHSAKKASSAADRKTVIDWWDGTISSRGKTRNVVRVVVMQRLNEDDLAGHIIENAKASGEWEILVLPMRAEPDRPECSRVTSIGWRDTRKEGELLWKAMPEKQVRSTEKEMGPFKAAGQLQQRPVPEGGGLFDKKWFPVIPFVKLPKQWPRLRYWDCAAGDTEQHDATAGIKMALDSDTDIFYVEDVQHARMKPGDRDQLITSVAAMDGPNVPIVIEEEGGGSGKDLIFKYQRLLRGYSIRGRRQVKNKQLRSDSLAGHAQAGLVRILAGENVDTLLAEIAVFPNGKHDDLEDACAGCFNELALTAEHQQNLQRELIASGDPDEDETSPLTDEELADPNTPQFLKDLFDTGDDDDDWRDPS